MTDRASTILKSLEAVSLPVDTSALSPGVRAALEPLARAFAGIDRVFRRQLGNHVDALVSASLSEDGDTPKRRALRYFNSPYDSLLGAGEPFIEGVDALPPGKALYPPDLSAEDFDAYVAAHPEQKAALLSPYTVIENDGEELIAIPYHERFAAALAPVVEALKDAARASDHEGLSRFLSSRADALAGSYDILKSEADWVRLGDTPLEVVIGPFEVYEDGLKGLKAFYEGMLLMVDREAGARLDEIERNLDVLAKSIPVPAGARPAVGGMAPMIVADELLTAGEGRAGVLASAFNLPNDPGVRGEVGWKQIMIRNVMQAKFNACTKRIAERMLHHNDVANATFEAYFYHVLLHEVSHGLGPAYRADGSPVNEVCGKAYTPLEEAKADTGALVLLLTHAGSHGIPAISRESAGASFVAGLYRSIRFGLHEAHGKANIVQYTYFREKGALAMRDGKLGVDGDKLPEAATALLNDLCRLQAAGSDTELNAFLDRYGKVPQELEAAVQSLDDLPIDILPSFELD